jgi:hypothetical protein
MQEIEVLQKGDVQLAIRETLPFFQMFHMQIIDRLGFSAMPPGERVGGGGGGGMGTHSWVGFETQGREIHVHWSIG